MLELGIFDGQRCELIDGELIDKMGQNPQHAQAIRNLFCWLIGLFGPSWCQMLLPIEVASGNSEWSLPEPDIAVLDEAGRDHGKRHPPAGARDRDELSLVAKVADTSLRQDLTRKRDLYARASIPEYWVLDLQSRRLIVHRNPGEGEYRETVILNEGDLVSFGGHTEHTVTVQKLFP